MKRLGLLLLTAVLLVVLAPTSVSAATGDGVAKRDEHYIDAHTNQCHVIQSSILEGGPYRPDNTTAYSQTYQAACTIRVRFRYVAPGTKTVRLSGWRYASGKDVFASSIKKVYRCNTDLDIRRKDGSYLHTYTTTVHESKYC